MTDLAIQVQNLAKQYSIGASRPRYLTLREQLVEAATGLFRRGQSSRGETIIWALDDVSFDVRQGEVIGVIGRNGAGKSTLLKILSRITEPTRGYARLCGRVGSLLEVGTGFHPELTGRENVYLNGSILGMRKTEIDRKFDEIVDFAEVEKFIDTPVKRYSSGMYVRLAFAVAAHLETEILLVDEVLAVGDVQFQKKSVGKMGDVASQGRTILFVSHNMPAVVQFCTDCIWLEAGKIMGRGNPKGVVPDYLAALQPSLSDQGRIERRMHAHEPRGMEFTFVQLLNTDYSPTSRLMLKEIIRLQCRFEVTKPLQSVVLGIVLHTIEGFLVLSAHSSEPDQGYLYDMEPGSYSAEIDIAVALMSGKYTIDVFSKPSGGWGSAEYSYDWVQRAVVFDIEDVTREGDGIRQTGSLLIADAQWRISPIALPAP